MTHVTLKRGLWALAAGSALALSACGGDSEQSGATLATVNGVAVKESRVSDQLGQIPPQLLQGRETEVKRQILDRVIDQELMLQEAKRLRVESTDEYRKQLKAVEGQLKINAVLAHIVKEKVTPESVKQVYEANKASFTFPAVKARHILVQSEAQARDILKVATPQNFSELAQKYGQGPSAQNGGDLGWIRRETMIPEFANVAFNTPAGQVASAPVRTQFGWHVVLVEQRNDRYVPPVEQLEPQIRQELAQKAVADTMAEMRKTATITYSDVAPAAGADKPAAQK